MTDRVLLIDPIDPSGVELLAHRAEIVETRDGDHDAVRRLAQGCDAAIIRSRLPENIFDAAPRLRAVTIHGTGTDLVPLASADAHGVLVANLPGENAQSVAEYCVMAMLMLARNAAAITGAMRSEPWDAARARSADVHEIAGMTCGLVGVGAIGSRVARILRHGFGMRVLGTQRRLNQLPPEAEPVTLDRLVTEADFIVLTVPLTENTHHLFDAARIARMRPGTWLINVGRGAVIDEQALVEALQARRIRGAMLDVFEHYRLAPGHPLYALDNAVLTPHLAGITRESRMRMGVAAAQLTLAMLAGERPANLINAQAWEAHCARRRAAGL
ncbi:MAG: NAD(P)-dependent oxidoreductase [Burkholderiales bacterium]|nr:NAD(P)-dependent oxidoreductase [Burkholderiales bacterium]